MTVRRQKLILPDVPEVPADGPMTIDEESGAHWRPAYDRGAWLLHTDPATEPSEPTMDVPTDHRFAFRLMDPGVAGERRPGSCRSGATSGSAARATGCCRPGSTR